MKSSKNKIIDEYEGLSISEIQNKKLVNVLKHKMFKGFEITKNSKTFYRKRPKCLRIIDFEEHNLEPYDVNYDIQYKRQFLKKLYQPKFETPFIIQNYSHKNVPNIKKLDSKMNKKQNIFLTDPKSKTRKYISGKEIDKNNKIINEIFPNIEEAKMYSNIPLLYVERSISRPKTSKEKIILSEGKEYGEYDGLTENQFIYKISHNNIQIDPSLNSFQASPRIKKGYTGRDIKSANLKEFYKKLLNQDVNNSNLSRNHINNNNTQSNDIVKTFHNISEAIKNNQKNNNIINNNNCSTINYQNNNSNINYFNINNKSFKDVTNKSSVANYNNDNDLGIQVTISSLKLDKKSESDSKKSNLIDNKKFKGSRNIKKGKNNIFQNSFIKREFPTNISEFYSVCPSYDNGHILFNKNDYRKKELKYLNEFNKKRNERFITNQLLIDENYYKQYYNNYLKKITTGTIE